MPELPEVETVRRGLEPALKHQVIAAVKLNRHNLRTPFPKGFSQQLEGSKIKAINRRAKYLLVDLNNDKTWVIHLGMSGRLVLEHKAQEVSPGDFYDNSVRYKQHDHVEVTFESGMRLIYNDPRRFGQMDIIDSRTQETQKPFCNIGVEPLSQDFTAQYLRQCAKNKTGSLKQFLLDQRYIAGLGNIYVCEALWLSRVSPFNQPQTITRQSAEKLVTAIKAVLQKAIKRGGSTLRDFHHVEGAQGEFQDEFKVYDREGQPCFKKGCKCLISRKMQGGRSTFFCQGCQPQI